MKRLWDKGGEVDDLVLRFTVGDDHWWDNLLVAYDVTASKAHVSMLASCGHLAPELAARLQEKLDAVGEAHANGEWVITREEEDCHTAIENRLGEDGAWVHLGRSRNDQVLAAMRLFLRDAVNELAAGTRSVAEALGKIQPRDQKIPGYTHLHRAMPSTVGLWADGFASELLDDAVGFQACRRRLGKNPLGSAAGYGTPGLALDRDQTTQSLGFSETQEPVTAVQLSRGKAEAEVAFACALVLQDLGRLAADLALFSSAEFGFVRLPGAFTTGSSIMPQKRNPDVFELVRAHSAQAPATVQAILALTAKMTSGYHRDLQLIKPPLFRLLDVTGDCLGVMAHALPHVEFLSDRCEAALDPSLFAAEQAFRLAKEQGIPFREAYKKIGETL